MISFSVLLLKIAVLGKNSQSEKIILGKNAQFEKIIKTFAFIEKNKKDPFSCFVNYSEAFDPINHEILITILEGNWNGCQRY